MRWRLALNAGGEDGEPLTIESRLGSKTVEIFGRDGRLVLRLALGGLGRGRLRVIGSRQAVDELLLGCSLALNSYSCETEEGCPDGPPFGPVEIGVCDGAVKAERRQQERPSLARDVHGEAGEEGLVYSANSVGSEEKNAAVILEYSKEDGNHRVPLNVV